MNTPTLFQSRAALRRRQTDAAAVELAVLILGSVVLLVPTFVLRRTLWQYNVLKHATHDAARDIAAVPLFQLSDPNTGMREVAKQMVASSLVAAGVAPASNNVMLVKQIDVYCPGVVTCTAGPPDTIVLQAYLSVSDPMSMTERTVKLTPFSTVRYGN